MFKSNTTLDPSTFESKWQKLWEEKRVYQPDLSNAKKPFGKAQGKPFYNLMMFPYPSAEGLHVGNMYAFTGADIYGRLKRMQGYDVFEPIGLDGFGIHSENYAIKIGKNPSDQAKISEKNFYRQLRAIGNGFAWENHLETYDPDYYRWTQWIFVRMFKAGLAYRKKSPVNFCPSCKTVLSDEQVIDGACERCKSKVEKRDMEQWYFRITRYADKLLNNIEKLEWTNKVKLGQRNWIGKKEGISIKYSVIAGPAISNNTSGHAELVSASHINLDITGRREIPKQVRDDKTISFITCFTTRPDTNFGATFIVIAPEHEFVRKILQLTKQDKIFEDRLLSESSPERVVEQENFRLRVNKIRNYLDKTKSISEQDRIAAGRKKTGIFTGFYAVNQLNGYKMPIYISDFVLGHVGTGAVVGVPGHDLRDFEFAKEFDIPIIRVVVGKDGDKSPVTKPGQVQEEEGTMVNSEFLNGLDIHKATVKMMDHLEEKGWGKRVTTFKLRDWCISRQRYWGAPIPMIFCFKCASKGESWFTSHKLFSSSESSKFKVQSSKLNENLKLEIGNSAAEAAGWFPVPEDQLPVLLPKDVKDWKPEGTGKGPLAKIDSFVKTNCPNCGGKADRETDVCDTFLDSSWYHLRYPSINQGSRIRGQGLEAKGSKQLMTETYNLKPEVLPWDPQITRRWLPVTQYIGGAEHTVLHLLYARFVAMVFKDLGMIDFEEPYTRFYAHGLIIAEGAKMSKSKGNVVIPDEYIRKYGADTLRTYLMFLGPFDMGGDFKDTGIAGMYRFLNRVWRLVSNYIDKQKAKPKETILKTGLMEKRSVHPKTSHYEEESGNHQGLEESEKFVSEDLYKKMHHTIKEVTDDLEGLRYNTAIAHIMEYVNEITNSKCQNPNLPKDIIETLLLLLAPFAPHMTEELWQKLSSKYQVAGSKDEKRKKHATYYLLHTANSIHLHPWPSYDPQYLVEDEATIIVQINGKVRDTVNIQYQISNIQKEVEEIVKNSEKAQKHLEGKSIRKVIFVPGKLINFVI